MAGGGEQATTPRGRTNAGEVRHGLGQGVPFKGSAGTGGGRRGRGLEMHRMYIDKMLASLIIEGFTASSAAFGSPFAFSFSYKTSKSFAKSCISLLRVVAQYW